MESKNEVLDSCMVMVMAMAMVMAMVMDMVTAMEKKINWIQSGKSE